MAIRVQPAAPEDEWITVDVDQPDYGEAIVSVNRDALESIIQDDSRPPEVILDILCERALKRMPLPNSKDGIRLITPYNLGLVWPK